MALGRHAVADLEALHLTATFDYLAAEIVADRERYLHPDPAELNSVYRATLAIAAGPAEFAAMARAMKRVDHAAC